MLIDRFAPVVFVTTQSTATRRLFALAHELAHVWLGETGISTVNDALVVEGHEIERACNRIAAALLLPAQLFRERWIAEVGLVPPLRIEKTRTGVEGQASRCRAKGARVGASP